MSSLPRRHAPASALVGALPRRLGRLWRALLGWHEIHRQRRALLELDPRLLRDIGLTPLEARREADRLLREELLGLRRWL